ncbi:hypothetical protein J437_LFUL012571 [Ladona fulva]|uniref:Uncharacterized protein n=1 Tax=Ladona fulva TaxID=123851 RepID=A0A8K0P624_LADFU|nr:hypothetical protein J437_LFUL012571 [Ladona fulva]
MFGSTRIKSPYMQIYLPNSVQLVVIKQSLLNVHTVLVGAPEAQTSQPGVSRGGAVFRCDTNRDDICDMIPFDSTGNNNRSGGLQMDQKSNQWFGATVRSSGVDGVVVVRERAASVLMTARCLPTEPETGGEKGRRKCLDGRKRSTKNVASEGRRLRELLSDNFDYLPQPM